MKYKLKLVTLMSALLPFYALAGGDPDFVKYPEGYQQIFTQYDTANRANQTQVAKFYANEIAVESYKKGEEAAPGSVVIMEIYEPKKDAEGKIVTGKEGLFEIEKLAAVAVMEKRNNWDKAFSSDNRTGDWGFAVYNPDGTPKSNDLNCVQCHTPLKNQDYLFSFQKLVDFAKNR
ncbi:cytochrome P460 family protein [Nitrosomonas sp.]|uniref:cytochrome P460 family protein n=1 Tax=Nitrosomonas sp. TaxID=42353 RepID=UPI00261D6CFD|nr:cytochrome P460 family protein [Nitrosomonas sp.]MCW5600993.1 cytochrome P460 family protein [Nitrosomonas sp.]